MSERENGGRKRQKNCINKATEREREREGGEVGCQKSAGVVEAQTDP